ncbi:MULTISPECIES: ribose 5-phosphate isomerase B [Enterococcus]|uniref:Ribose 5-phosphate isomerase B n=1 Tax=Enterococcus malodoratus ATCC 43197 TaxID=1158601 RepID=R2NR92_9ENTE|nr:MULTISPECIES: ribose 5-phosphate isomerase B [Enterococcus]EOH73483.1 ribose 5-phosphate isomerase B [Enterococcus malodoratus ATCC 43197]EOT67241.1 ribose 5-phosphate isomerase B [Enterococcus malodoratus ATCC 43197]OJG57513.1 ribose 5-phosphate isomerase B [Enterococcus malodoratus]SET54902.1 ribose 5-phosphate isomerase B [Enterococcus malodoratus]SPW90881.1 galactose-6-phosphate isomerase, LacB subunit [Enterococcus malodoratus]
MKVAIGCDDNALQLKEAIKDYLDEKGYEVVDYGIYEQAPADYPKVAFKAAKGILNGEAERGILFCGTGIGMALAANKVKGIRAAQTHDAYSAQRAELSNHAQIITIGAQVVGIELAKVIVSNYLDQHFTTEGRGKNSARKIDEITTIETEQGVEEK